MKEKKVYAEECNQLGRICYYNVMLVLTLPMFLFFFIFWLTSSDHLIVNCSGVNLKSLVHAAENYQAALAENRKLFNEVQELKGGIFCVCLPDYVGEQLIHIKFFLFRKHQSVLSH